MHISPDQFLQTSSSRVWTPERNQQAWCSAYRALDRVLSESRALENIYLLIGAQGSGKSTWVRTQGCPERSVYFDAILVKRSERAEVLKRIRPFGVPAIAVWMKTPLSVCIERNASRAADELVNEQALRNVYAALEPPSIGEGFHSILEVPLHNFSTGSV
ncbi:MAG: hypothetical protein EOO28_05270 [Comamonadaceae bacterium]|nr:MAG: hypothetical protein EOO28_05270 [Comamonadaceae bacterium]